MPTLKFSFVIKKDTNLTVQLGKRATIDCSTDDQGAKVGLYKLDGTSYAQVVDGPNMFELNGVFYIKSTFFDDTGSYRCEAVDQQGNKITKKVSISLDTGVCECISMLLFCVIVTKCYR